MKPSDQIHVTILIPLLNEEGSLPELYQKLVAVLERLGRSFEILFIDDGSRDRSNEIILGFRKSDPRVRLITFRRNQGKSAALGVGFHEAHGEYLVTMDADLQDDPEEIPNLIDKLESGYDLISGWKKVRHDPITKTLPSKLFNYTTGKLSGIRLHDFNCGLKIYRREVVQELHVYGERHRFLPVIAHMQGFRVAELAVTHHPRVHGKTKFGAYRFLAGFFDLITLLFRMKFVTKPLHLFGTFGLLSLLTGLSIIGYLSIGWFQGHWIGNRPILLIGVLGVVTGVQLFTLGLLAEMIAEKSGRGAPPIRADSDLKQDIPQP
jgi:glycosyltransferase involved in cell wall biosynthesis